MLVAPPHCCWRRQFERVEPVAIAFRDRSSAALAASTFRRQSPLRQSRRLASEGRARARARLAAGRPVVATPAGRRLAFALGLAEAERRGRLRRGRAMMKSLLLEKDGGVI